MKFPTDLYEKLPASLPSLSSLPGVRLPRRLRPAMVTLNFDSGQLRFLTAKGGRVTAWGSEELEPGSTRGGVITDAKSAGERLSEVFSSHSLKRGRIVASLSGQRSVPRILVFPEMKSRLLDEAIPREMKREMPVPLDEMSLSWQVIDRESGRVRAFALGVPRDLIAPLVEAVGRTGRKLYSVETKPLALARVVGRSEALIADLEPESIDVVVVRGGVPETIRTVSLGADVGGVEEKVAQFAEELTRTVKFYTDTHPEDPLPEDVPLFLTGSLAEQVPSSGGAQAVSRYPLTNLDPPLECPPDLPVQAFAVNLGLALKES